MLFHAIVAVVCCGLSFSGLLWANELPLVTDTLPEITVIDTTAVTTPGKSLLNRATLQALPQGNGAITDLLKVLPGVQFGEVDNSSLTGGEILPVEISISGGRVYDNNFMIDGMSNNSLLDPTASTTYSITSVPGHSQELFLDSSLLESVAVQRSNISARYSGFTGGVVEMETRNPAEDFGGQFGYRTTRSEWTSFHVEREDREDFERSERADSQPEFNKHSGNFSLDIPLNEQMGVLVAYSQSYSKIPLNLLGKTENQYRKAENLFVKYRFQPNAQTDLIVSALWTPYQGEYFIKNTRNSSFSVEGGGISLNTKLKQKFDFGQIEYLFGWRQSENSRRSPNGFYSWDLDVESTNWGDGYSKYSQEGGYGDVDNIQESLTLACHAELQPWRRWGLQHVVASGISYERSQAQYERLDTTLVTQWTDHDSLVCAGSDNCIADEQYAKKKRIYAIDSATAEVIFVDAYVQDSLQWWRLTLRPGLHAGYNDLSKNTDYAARSLLSYNVFADETTVIHVGANRYYGKTFLTYALNEKKIGSTYWKRSLVGDSPGNWVDNTTVSRTSRLSSLKTPLVDEWSVGLEHECWGGLLTLNYIDRNSEDGLAYFNITSDDGEMYKELNNNGEGRHKEVTLAWERRWQNQYLLVDATWQDSESSNDDYSDRLDLEDLDELVWYNGHTTDLINLPRCDYNREWSVNLIYRVSLPYGFSFTNITRYRSGYAAISDTKENHVLPDGDKIDVYADVSYPSSTIFDWKLEWECSLAETQTMTLYADVTNVFNRKLYTGIEGEYQMGRQLWVGMEYTF